VVSFHFAEFQLAEFHYPEFQLPVPSGLGIWLWLTWFLPYAHSMTVVMPPGLFSV